MKAELHRHKGQLLLRQGHPEPAEEPYREALRIAEEQAAKFGNYGQRRVLPACGPMAVVVAKPATSSPRSTSGSPRASTRST